MKFLLVAVNAKYIHSNPAVYSLKAFAKEQRPKADIEIGEYTINHQMDHVLEDIYRRKPDFVGFSCYIWNISQVLEITRDLHKVLPKCEIWLGGPEVSYNAEEILMREPQIRGIMRGEGELTFTELVSAYMSADYTRINQIQGITCRGFSGKFYANGPQRLLSMDEIPFYYADMTGFENRIVYYESSRGCPFSCSYCLSSIDKSVRFRSLELVKKELDFFLEHKVPQVKFVDRTFNCKREHTLGIWKHILENDNGVTNFHFEVSADLFDEEELALIAKMRPGLIQLEIGVQSTNLNTISEIHRRMDLGKLKKRVDRIHSYRNTHQHLDLIAGLPYENMESFLMSFDDVYDMKPDQLQLGFLKVLKGSMLHQKQKEYEIVYHDTAPYEVMTTHRLPYEDTLKLKYIEEMVETYYNSGKFLNTLAYLVPLYESPFAFYEALSQFWLAEGCQYKALSKIGLCDVLWEFVQKNEKVDLNRFQWAMKFDIALHEKPKKLPQWLHVGGNGQEFERITAKLAQKYIPSYLEAEKKTLIKNTYLDVFGEENPKAILLDYGHRDLLENAEYLVLPMAEAEELLEAEKNKK